MGESRSTRHRVVGLLVGGLVGAVVGLIAAVNVVIYSGIESGYETSLPELFDYNVVAGVVTVLILVAAPILGVVVARRIRARRSSDIAD